VSVLDSAFMLGDGVWEGLRLHRGVLLFAQEHLERLLEGAASLDMQLGLSLQQLQQMVYDTVDANGMTAASGEARRLRGNTLGHGGVTGIYAPFFFWLLQVFRSAQPSYLKLRRYAFMTKHVYN
jgi:branched-subunit amino acid aminotransferase/4-amino-4-deoxychorismate lyase